jgi:hypothetical protein
MKIDRNTGELRVRYPSMFLLIVLVALGSYAYAAHRNRQADRSGQRMLVFSIDQGAPNEAVANRDTAALQRVLNDVKAFETRFDTYVLLAGDPENPTLDDALRLVVANKVKFVLDAMSSVAVTKDPIHELGKPYNKSYAQLMSVDQLSSYKQRYGNYFAGIRIMELLSMHFTIHKSEFHGAHWNERSRQFWPPGGDLFQASVLEPYFRWAAQQGMFVDFSDWLWSFDHRRLPSDIAQPEHEEQLRSMVQRYPNVVIVTYANNEPEGRARRANWVPFFRQWLDNGARGFGLSDQDWICKIPHEEGSEMNCPPEELVGWAQRAYRAGALMVQLEPAWYFWNFARGRMTNDYNTVAADQRGRAKPSLEAFARAFDVQLPND